MNKVSEYTKRVTIQEATRQLNDIGGWKNQFSDYYSSWARVKRASAAKQMSYGRLNFTESYEVELLERETRNVDGNCRVVYKGNVFQIASIQTDEGVIYLDIVR